MSFPDKYDNAFLGVLQNEGQIENFLDVFFSFLYRRTDFFRHLIFPKDKYGFRPGMAKKLVLNAFKKYEDMAAGNNLKLKEAYDKFLEEENARMEADRACQMVVDEELVEEVIDATQPIIDQSINQSQEQKKTSLSSQNDDKDKSLSNDIHEEAELSQQDAVMLSNMEGTSNVSDVSSVENPAKNEGANKNEARQDSNEDANAELERAQKIYQANPESYNGAMRDNYNWSQSITDLDVRVKIPSFIKKSKDLSVKADRKHLKVSYKGLSGSEVIVVDDDLCWEVHRDETTWTMIPGEHVHLNMEKVQERWWDGLLMSEPKISTRKIDPSRPITDLGDEEQAKIEEMMYNERQKKLGLPQSHEQKTHEMLKKAWDAEGSPFKGQPFDPSKFNISPGGF